MESQTQIKNIIGTDHEKIEMLLSSLKDIINDKTAWIMICLILFEFILMIALALWIIFAIRLLNRYKEEEIVKIEEIKPPCYEVIQRREEEESSQISR